MKNLSETFKSQKRLHREFETKFTDFCIDAQYVDLT